jgi:hypothetical protein
MARRLRISPLPASPKPCPIPGPRKIGLLSERSPHCAHCHARAAGPAALFFSSPESGAFFTKIEPSWPTGFSPSPTRTRARPENSRDWEPVGEHHITPLFFMEPDTATNSGQQTAASMRLPFDIVIRPASKGGSPRASSARNPPEVARRNSRRLKALGAGLQSASWGGVRH